MLDRGSDAYTNEKVLQDFGETVGTWLGSLSQEFIGQFFGLGMVGIEIIFFGFLFAFKVSFMEAADKITFFDLMLAGFSIGAIDEAFEEIIVSSSAGGIVRFKTCHDSQKREGASLFNPFGNAGFSKESHKGEGTGNRDRITMRSAFNGRIEAVKNLYGGIEVEVG